MATIQIPVLFDMSGDTIVYGEEASGDFVSSHLEFVLDMTTEANGISLNAADISAAILVGDQDTGDNIFYSGGSSGNIAVDNLCNRIAKAITRGKLVHLPKTGNTSNSGIPMGGRANLYDLNGVYTENGNNDKYAIKYNTSIAPIGDEQMLGQAMARVASIHLVGSPLSAGIFQDKNQIQNDLETASAQTFNSENTAFYNALAVQFSKVLGGSKSSAPMNPGVGYPLDASGTSVPALKSIYEQLMNVPGRSQIMETRDVSGTVDNSNVTLAGGFPFISGDKLVVYLRPKINFAAQTQPEQHSTAIVGFPDKVMFNVPVYNIADISGSITSQTYDQSSTQDNSLFGFNRAVNGLGVTGNYYWTSAGGTYNSTTGVHTGAGQTTNVDGANTIAGEWGQVNIGASTYVQELSLTTNNDYEARMPEEFMLLGSNDGTNWTKMIHATNEVTPWTDSTPRTFSNNVAKAFTYYRYVVIKGPTADARTSLGYFNLKGSLATEAFIQVGGKAGEPGFQPIAQAVQDISGLITNFTATAQNIEDAFPGNATTGPESEPLKWGWMGSANSDTLSLDTTDINDTATIDLHIWKITITL
jgi:hypothetical protein